MRKHDVKGKDEEMAQDNTMTRRSFLAAFAVAAGGLALAGCSQGSGGASTSSAASSASSAATASSTATSASSATASASSSQASSSAQESTSSSAAGASGAVLVACFSATGNTRAIAENAAKLLGADYVEIEPLEPYTAADLEYNDETTRATAEQNEPSTRPELRSHPDFSGYDTILLGHPIWWGKAPRLLCTLVESADLSGKRVAEFCTSGSSGISEAAAELEQLASGAEWIGANRFEAGAAESEIAEWLDSLDITR